MGIVSMTLLIFAVGLLLAAGISGGSALGLHLLAPQWSRRRRIVSSASLATAVLMALPVGGLAVQGNVGNSGDALLAWTAMVVTGFTAWSVLCLPAAWWATMRVERAEQGKPAIEHDEDEPALIAAES